MKAEALSSRLAKSWHDIVRDVEQEKDPLRIRDLARQLNEAMLSEERKKVEQKLGSLHHMNGSH
jgi:hypothetical protein